MTKPPTLHRFILVDQNHAKKVECTAHGLAGAREAFEALRQAKGIKRPAIPTSWTIVKREPVKSAPAQVREKCGNATAAPKPEPEPQTTADPQAQASRSEPRAFQVGDEVRGKTGRNGCGPVMQGVVFKTDGEGDIHFRTKDDPRSLSRWAHPSNLTLLEPAPQPKAEEAKVPAHLLSGMVDRFLGWKLPADFNPDGGISFDANRLGLPRLSPTGTNLLDAIQAKAMLEHVAGPALAECQGAVDSINEILIKHQGILHDARQEVATLEAEVKRLNLACDGWRQDAQTRAQNEAHWKAKAEAAEAKLDDIRAIKRVAEIVNARPDDAEPWHWQGLVQSILDGAA